MGDGAGKSACQDAAAGLDNVFFEARIPYAELPARIRRADILLGVFGTTQKAGRVIPNKVFQALAAGRPVVTQRSAAYPEPAPTSSAMAFVPPGDPQALADAVAAWALDPEALIRRQGAARHLYETCFSEALIRDQLAQCLRAD